MTEHTTEQGAREALVEQLAEAMSEAEESYWHGDGRGTDLPHDLWIATSLLPVVAAQVEAAVSVVRAEAERQAVLLRAINDCHLDPARAILQADKLAGAAIIRAVAAESEVRALREKVADVWDEGAEATAEWMANNPGPSGIPHDPPSNPYAAALSDPTTPDQKGGDRG